MNRPALLALAASVLLLTACAADRDDRDPAPQPAPAPAATDVPAKPGGDSAAPIALSGTAYDAALVRQLPERQALNWEDLHNVYKLSDNIISGGEPLTPAALERLAKMGIKTVMSVDGKAPDVETATRLGMRYVHIPIQYSGISYPERVKMAKTFRELEGPFYVHCFHGKHRGPAAAAVGRVVLDGCDREDAIAEMRQWLGTSKNYEGLYRTIAAESMPSEKVTAAFDWDFPAVDAPEGFVGSMVTAARVNDNLKLLYKVGWGVDADHPDLDSLNEAKKMAAAMQHMMGTDEVHTAEADFKDWADGAKNGAEQLLVAIESMRRGDAAAKEKADAGWSLLSVSCRDCHKKYRND